MGLEPISTVWKTVNLTINIYPLFMFFFNFTIVYLILLTTSSIIFIIGILGIFLARKNIILVLICIEVMLIALNIFFVFFSIYLDDILGYFFSFFILTLAAAESAIGLAILIVFYRLNQSINIDFLSYIKA